MEKGAISRTGKMRNRISLVKAQARWKRDDIVALCQKAGEIETVVRGCILCGY
jgi:hypothetical protein